MPSKRPSSPKPRVPKPKASRPRKKEPEPDLFTKLLNSIFGTIGVILEQHTQRLLHWQCPKCHTRVSVVMRAVPSYMRLYCSAGCGPVMEQVDPLQNFIRPEGVPPPRRKVLMSVAEAARFMSAHCGHISADPQEFVGANAAVLRKSAYRKIAARLHPDNKETGNEELFKKLQEAMEVLEG